MFPSAKVAEKAKVVAIRVADDELAIARFLVTLYQRSSSGMSMVAPDFSACA
jgi:hypothetical protein